MKDQTLLNMIKSQGFDKTLFLHYLTKSAGKQDISEALITKFQEYDKETIDALLPYIW